MRYLAELKGGKKGSLSETVEQALEVFEREMSREEAWKQAKVMADANMDWGVGKFDRKELYKGKRFG